jgi:hypothetical protein
MMTSFMEQSGYHACSLYATAESQGQLIIFSFCLRIYSPSENNSLRAGISEPAIRILRSRRMFLFCENRPLLAQQEKRIVYRYINIQNTIVKVRAKGLRQLNKKGSIKAITRRAR